MNSISLDSPTLRFGIGCFETIKVLPQKNSFKAAFLPEHIERLIHAAKVCRLDCPSKEEIESQVISFLENKVSTQMQVLRLILTKECGLYCSVEPFSQRANSITVQTSRDWIIESSSPLNKFKSFNYLKNYLACLKAQEEGFNDVLLLNEKKEIAELTKANLFFLTQDNRWITPEVSSGCLPGITRKVLIPILKAQEDVIHHSNLNSFKSVIAVNSLIGAQNITQIDDIKFEIIDVTKLNSQLEE
jgi:branched-chain amino acid aminotransferase